jgi:glycosyltransferase involved in cell wall biosynthesis
MDLISVIVPVYKAERYLNRCVESLLSQTYQNFEIILVDDNSPDKCPDYCDDYAKLYSNIVTVHLKDSGFGVSGARNCGLDFAKGDYIVFVDSDDYVHKDLLLNLKIAMDLNPIVGLSMCSYQMVTERSNQMDSINEMVIRTLSVSETMELVLHDQYNAALWGKLYRKSIFSDLRFPIGKYSEDIFLTPFIMRNAKYISYFSQPLYYYFQDNESMCRSDFNYNKLDVLEAIGVWIEQAQHNYPGLSARVESHYYATMINLSQYLVNRKDAYGQCKFRLYQQELKSNFLYLFRSKYLSVRDKLKLILVKVNLFYLLLVFLTLLYPKRYN